ncbi:probable E3 ubiquitin-protein ligase RNF217 [Synchiropus splendidus]|uniref:probable E3 ubiquitin-protein ligase RNF217 n=1 Tax=Synchiropus splendidus TaxID=270530 RepID=UPI00237D865A|nr:probable E3 ubiquitin-protein ligase RNF217 [Synchiropus splendidus]
MGRDTSVMEDEGPMTDKCKMPSFIRSFDQGRARVSRSQTSLSDTKVDRSVDGPIRRVSRVNSRLSLDEGAGESGGSGGSEKDAESNNNNNCNSAGGERRRSSAVEILMRNFGVTKPPSLRLGGSGRLQSGEVTESPDKSASDVRAGDECQKSHQETGDAVTENESTSTELPTSTGQRVGSNQLKAKFHHDCDSLSLDETNSVKEDVYCSVYCIADDSRRQSVEITACHDETVAEGAQELASETKQVAGSSPAPVPYTLDDLMDSVGDMTHWWPLEGNGEEEAVQICRVCLEEKTIAPLPCCRKALCEDCVRLYVSSQVRVAKAYIHCPIPECSGFLEDQLVIAHLSKEDVAKYRYFLELSRLDSSTKPCPQCSQFTSLDKHNLNRSEHRYKIQCSNCQFVWCFKCHAPWHNGIKCRDYRKGDKLLRNWASVIEHGQRNAQKCPKCKIHIQRTEGCDHMTCTQCNTNFCYRCGERYRHLRFFGDHTSNLSVFGCKYRYLPDRPHLRRLIRGSVCGTKLLMAPVVILVVIVLGALAAVIGLVAFPVYYVCKRRKKQHTQGSGRWI